MKLFALLVGACYASKTWQQCADENPDYIGRPNGPKPPDGTISPEEINPTNDRTNWMAAFHNAADYLMQISDDKDDIARLLIRALDEKWPVDGWFVVVADDNSNCTDIDPPEGQNSTQCYDKWYTGCREKGGSANCRNAIVVTEFNNTGNYQMAMAIQVNREIEHMQHPDHVHVWWEASHAEGAGPGAGVNDRYGISAISQDWTNEEHRRMAAKIIWQNYREALDKEYLFQNDETCSDWNGLVTFCEDFCEECLEDGQQSRGDIAFRSSNLDDHYFNDAGKFRVGLPETWYASQGVINCVTAIITPFSH